MFRLDMEKEAEVEKREYEEGRGADIGALQVAVYVACGGGQLGFFAARQPADFFIDSEAGNLPYERTEIEQAVKVLSVVAAVQGLNPHKLPEMPNLHGCGVF